MALGLMVKIMSEKRSEHMLKEIVLDCKKEYKFCPTAKYT